MLGRVDAAPAVAKRAPIIESWIRNTALPLRRAWT